MVYREKAFEKTGLHYENEADVVEIGDRDCKSIYAGLARLQAGNGASVHTCGFTTMKQKISAKCCCLNEKTSMLNPTYQLLITIKMKFTFFNFRIKANCLKIMFFSTAQINLHKRILLSIGKISIQLNHYFCVN